VGNQTQNSKINLLIQRENQRLTWIPKVEGLNSWKERTRRHAAAHSWSSDDVSEIVRDDLSMWCGVTTRVAEIG
jgi:hypothetical protein